MNQGSTQLNQSPLDKIAKSGESSLKETKAFARDEWMVREIHRDIRRQCLDLAQGSSCHRKSLAYYMLMAWVAH